MMVCHLCNHDQVRGVVENPCVLERPVLARDSLVLNRFGEDDTHPFTWFYRSDPSYSVGPVRVSEECTREDSGARTDSERTSILTGGTSGRRTVVLDDVERIGSNDLLTDVLESIRRVRWTSSE